MHLTMIAAPLEYALHVTQGRRVPAFVGVDDEARMWRRTPYGIDASCWVGGVHLDLDDLGVGYLDRGGIRAIWCVKADRQRAC